MILLVLALTASSPHHSHVPCWIVRSYIAIYGDSTARTMALARGYTEAEIAAVRARCLLVAPKPSGGGK